MSSLSWNACDPSSTFLPTQVPDKKTYVLNHISASKNLIDVRPASRLEVRPRPEMISTGITEVDALTGGLPRGCLSEICGHGSSGKTSVLLATLAAATRRDESCVLVDASDSFDPESGTAARIDFWKLLWVRCGKKLLASSALRFSGQAENSLQLSVKNIIAHDERPSSTDLSSHNIRRATHDTKSHSERRLEQVLKITDLILQSGGFGLVALDLAGIAEKFVRRIPLASWFRFQRAVEHTKTALLVVSESPCAQTCANVVLKFSTQHSALSTQPGSPHSNFTKGDCPTLVAGFTTGWEFSREPTHSLLLEGMQVEAALARTRLERKPMRSEKANFATRAVRAG
ncbi:MAG TPA: hypothetical protein VJO35_07255 [Terriglobales bacterium]|nr:hypothetical protein [Terriglobales bacterium]